MKFFFKNNSEISNTFYILYENLNPKFIQTSNYTKVMAISDINNFEIIFLILKVTIRFCSDKYML